MSQLSLAISYQYDITSIWYNINTIYINFNMISNMFHFCHLWFWWHSTSPCMFIIVFICVLLLVCLSVSVCLFFIFLPVSASYYFILLQFSIDRFFAIWVSILQPFRFAIFLINYLTALASAWLYQSRLSPGQLFLACAEVTGHRPALFTLSVL